MEELDIKWTFIELGLIFLAYIIGSNFLQLLNALYGWIITFLAVAVVVSPEFTEYIRYHIYKVVTRYRRKQTYRDTFPEFENSEDEEQK